MSLCSSCAFEIVNSAAFCGNCGNAAPEPVEKVHTTDDAAPDYSKRARAEFIAHQNEAAPTGYGYQTGRNDTTDDIAFTLPKTVDLTDPSLKESWKTVTDKKAVNTWVIFGFEGKTDKLVHIESGNGIKTLIKALSNKQGRVLFGGIKVIGIDKSLGLLAAKMKYCYFSFCGSAIPELVRAQLNTLKRKVEAFFGSVSLSMDVYGSKIEDEISYNRIGFRLFNGSGAHKDSHYQFGDYELDCKTLQAASDNEDSDSEMSDF